jgi:hypothetical protein
MTCVYPITKYFVSIGDIVHHKLTGLIRVTARPSEPIATVSKVIVARI